jgi:hypothetical protein
MKIRMSTDPNGAAVSPDYTTTDHDGYNGYFSFIVNAFGSAKGQIRYLWVVDGSGRAISDPVAAKAVFNDLQGSENPNACWNIQIMFVRSQ